MTLPPLITVLCSPSLGHLRPSIGAFFTLAPLLIDQKCGRSCSCARPEGARTRDRRLVGEEWPSGNQGAPKRRLEAERNSHSPAVKPLLRLGPSHKKNFGNRGSGSFFCFYWRDCSPFYRFSHHQVEFEPRTGELHVVVYRLFSRQNRSLNIF